jgi:hypothetical protein
MNLVIINHIYSVNQLIFNIISEGWMKVDLTSNACTNTKSIQYQNLKLCYFT